jgi:preprotein translocase subunit SecE
MKNPTSKLVMHALLFVLVIVVMSAVAIWLGLGPVVR